MDPISLDQVRERQDSSEELYHEFLRAATLSVGRYVLPAGGEDPQSPHTEDEIYYVLAGTAKIRIGDDIHPVEADDVVYVERGRDHEFVDIEQRLELLVVFAPAEGTLAEDE